MAPALPVTTRNGTMRPLAASILMLALAQSAAAQPPARPPAEEGDAAPAPSGAVLAAVPGMGLPFAIRHLACDEVRFVIPAAAGVSGIAASPESVVVVKNEGGTTGIRFVVDRQTGATAGIQTWRNLAGMTVTTLPAAVRVDWVNCQDAEPMGGIVVEWVDVRAILPR